MKRNVLVSGVIVALFVGVIGAVLAFAPDRGSGGPGGGGGGGGGAVDAATLVRENSHRLQTAADGKVTVVEFLDFECEACRAAYPVVEDLRAKYEGKVTFVLRYFPIPSHQNSMNAAVAVEAAAQQGKLEPMYKKMYDTQAQWGEQQESRAPLFRQFAQELGLDLAAYDKAVADPATQKRVEADRNDGVALGVQGTPTFFLNGTMIQPQSVQDFEAKIDAALAK
ncbi:thioredoxin domain-containing protein [Knoellia koreensis]|uniref:Thioredoxin domain-containing protein n=1 Tax=Knoellia koreensis TaxID=2730921 RepID=A0A849HJ83_9MICO|nr:thioredoxin domain-containing protein [Knoellia sp. DB2414S]